jgi:DNA-binding ferritin-like protein
VNQNQRDKQAYLNATPMQREVVRRLLCDVLACLRAQALSYQTSHWQVVGQSFYGNHLLFQRLYESVQGQVDGLAEKIVGYLGRQIVGLEYQMKHVWGYTQRWSQIDCHHKRGLQSEADLQASLKRAYDGIKQVKAMTLGLDDWIMATANAHEENEYLLQQALTPGPGQKQASFKRPDGFYLERHAPMGRDDFNNYEFVNKYDPVARYWKPMDKKELDRILAYWKRTKADWAWRWEEVRGGRVVKKDEGSGSRFERSYDGPGYYDSDSDSYFRRRSAVAPAAPSEEHRFFDNPEKREVREFANTGAISNSPEIAAEASEEDQLDVSEAKAVAEAEAAPPTPEEIKAEPGGKAVSTLNRFVVESEDPDAGQAAEDNKPLLESKKLMAAWLREIEND